MECSKNLIIESQIEMNGFHTFNTIRYVHIGYILYKLITNNTIIINQL